MLRNGYMCLESGLLLRYASSNCVYVNKNWIEWNSEKWIKSNSNVMQNMCTELIDLYSTIGWTTFIFICVTPEILTVCAIPLPPYGRLSCLKLFARVAGKPQEQKTGLRPVITFFTLYRLPMFLHTHICAYIHIYIYIYIYVILFTYLLYFYFSLT